MFDNMQENLTIFGKNVVIGLTSVFTDMYERVQTAVGNIKENGVQYDELGKVVGSALFLVFLLWV